MPNRIAKVLVANPDILIRQTELLSDNWYKLNKRTFDLKQRNGEWRTQSREGYDRGNGAVVRLFDPSRGTVVLTRQFRIPTYLNGNSTGMVLRRARDCWIRILPKSVFGERPRKRQVTPVKRQRKYLNSI